MSQNSQHSVTITGVTTGISPSGVRPPRTEINDFVNDEKMFSLYVQAMTLMTGNQLSQQDVLSHFQIGGIHGKPYTQWDHSGGATPAPRSWQGYCTHGSVLFPSWHRPYVALYEQALHTHVMSVAATYTSADKADWLDAANRFRVPYWDWASNSVPPSQIISDQTVTILAAPGATSQSVANPLLGYRFHPVTDGHFDSPWSHWPATLRCPDSTGRNAQSDVDELTSNLTGPNGQIQYQLMQATYFLLTQVNSWLDMSNHTPNINPNAANSLEKIHDNIHVYCGGDNEGHMGDPTVAGMDPIFFMHHANVDRLLALWQAIHYQSFLQPSVSNDGTYTIRSNTRVTSQTDLTPFWNGPTTYWNSDACRDWTQLGYTYPEFVGFEGLSPDQIANHIKDVVDQLYGGGTGGSLTGNFISAASVGDAAGVAKVASAAASSAGAAVAGAAQAILGTGSAAGKQKATTTTSPASESVRDWSVRIQSKKFQLGGSYSVFIFLGEVPSDPKQWRRSKSLVGTDEIFANSSAGHCANCMENQEIVVEGYVHLNQALLAAGLESLDPDVVVPYLEKNLSWRVYQHREVVPMARLDSLKVTVTSTPLHLRQGDKFPQAGHVQHHHEITRGQPGGHLA